MRKWFKEHGLLLVNLGLFVVFLGGMILTGAANYNEEQAAHGQPTVSVLGFLGTGEFVEATFENWESEFLQMGMYVVLTIFLFQKGSSESKPIGPEAEQDQEPRKTFTEDGAPGPVKKGGFALKVYEHSLSLLLFGLFFASFALHAVGGADAYNEEQQSHGGETVTTMQYLGTSRFWFESFQNWQSEFLAVAVLVGASVYLREKGSPESKPVDEPHSETGA
ncbi:DUF6766 family protein [Pseudarthrobacter sp. J75]|uniref:DUF6766 family protein n=1 Tax=unclassified Pseudarthrobacter TaxID=2647000 RepID=UPI002E8119A6|nr:MULTISPECIES: DUF6766 family protein [unclassified Pseudarthrobacter]MEE2522047.1 DUF6766 family protein [Pseudarthrobacter sp. J47]MEE2528972.1 DUF6766 family protein [Pseudarthrobacter sp. J75]